MMNCHTEKTSPRDHEEDQIRKKLQICLRQPGSIVELFRTSQFWPKGKLGSQQTLELQDECGLTTIISIYWLEKSTKISLDNIFCRHFPVLGDTPSLGSPSTRIKTVSKYSEQVLVVWKEYTIVDIAPKLCFTRVWNGQALFEQTGARMTDPAKLAACHPGGSRRAIVRNQKSTFNCFLKTGCQQQKKSYRQPHGVQVG